jgi:drug/metabolite transporter (DMT)-like permease
VNQVLFICAGVMLGAFLLPIPFWKHIQPKDKWLISNLQWLCFCLSVVFLILAMGLP